MIILEFKYIYFKYFKSNLDESFILYISFENKIEFVDNIQKNRKWILSMEFSL